MIILLVSDDLYSMLSFNFSFQLKVIPQLYRTLAHLQQEERNVQRRKISTTRYLCLLILILMKVASLTSLKKSEPKFILAVLRLDRPCIDIAYVTVQHYVTEILILKIGYNRSHWNMRRNHRGENHSVQGERRMNWLQNGNLLRHRTKKWDRTMRVSELFVL